MKNKKYFNAYGIDLTYQINTYKKIGSDYGNSKEANLGLDLNLARWVRKNITNKKEQKYKRCDKHSEWKEYVVDSLPKSIGNKEDMIHFLFKNKMFAHIYYDLIKSVLIPVYIGILAAFECFAPETTNGIVYSNEVRYMVYLFLAVVIVIISTCAIIDADQRIHFYNDYISIVEETYCVDNNQDC